MSGAAVSRRGRVVVARALFSSLLRVAVRRFSTLLDQADRSGGGGLDALAGFGGVGNRGVDGGSDVEGVYLAGIASLTRLYRSDPVVVLRHALRLLNCKFVDDAQQSSTPPEILLAYKIVPGQQPSDPRGADVGGVNAPEADLAAKRHCIFEVLTGVLQEGGTSILFKNVDVPQWISVVTELVTLAVTLLADCAALQRLNKLHKHAVSLLENTLTQFLTLAASPAVAPDLQTTQRVTELVLDQCRSGEAPLSSILLTLSAIADNARVDNNQVDAVDRTSAARAYLDFVSRAYVKLVPILGSVNSPTPRVALAHLLGSLAACAAAAIGSMKDDGSSGNDLLSALGPQTRGAFEILLEKWSTDGKIEVRAATASALVRLCKLLPKANLRDHVPRMLDFIFQQLQNPSGSWLSSGYRSSLEALDNQLTLVSAIVSFFEFICPANGSDSRTFEEQEPPFVLRLDILVRMAQLLVLLRPLFPIQVGPAVPTSPAAQRTHLRLRAEILRWFDVSCFVVAHDAASTARTSGDPVDAVHDSSSTALTTAVVQDHAAARTLLKILCSHFTRHVSAASGASAVAGTLNALAIIQHLATQPRVAKLMLHLDAAPTLFGSLRPLLLHCDSTLQSEDGQQAEGMSRHSEELSSNGEGGSAAQGPVMAQFPMLYALCLQLCHVILSFAQGRLIFARSRRKSKKKKKTESQSTLEDEDSQASVVVWSDSRLQDGVFGMLQFVIHQCGFSNFPEADRVFTAYLDQMPKKNTTASWWGNLLGGGPSSSGNHKGQLDQYGKGSQAGAVEQLSVIDASPLRPSQHGRLASRLLVHLGRRVGTPMLKVMLTALIHSQSQFLSRTMPSMAREATSTGDYSNAVMEALVLFCDDGELDGGDNDDGSQTASKTKETSSAKATSSTEQLRSLIKSDFANGKSGAKKRALLFGRLLVLAVTPLLLAPGDSVKNESVGQLPRNALRLLQTYLPFLVGAKSRSKFTNKRNWAALFNVIEDHHIVFGNESGGNNSGFFKSEAADEVFVLFDRVMEIYVSDNTMADWASDMRSTFELTLFRILQNRRSNDANPVKDSPATQSGSAAHIACLLRFVAICLRHCSDVGSVRNALQRLVSLLPKLCTSWPSFEAMCCSHVAKTVSLAPQPVEGKVQDKNPESWSPREGSAGHSHAASPTINTSVGIYAGAIVERALVRSFVNIASGSDGHGEAVTSALAARLTLCNQQLHLLVNGRGSSAGSGGQDGPTNETASTVTSEEIKRTIQEDRAMVRAGQRSLETLVKGNTSGRDSGAQVPSVPFLAKVHDRLLSVSAMAGTLRWMLCAAVTARIECIDNSGEAMSMADALLFNTSSVLQSSLTVEEQASGLSAANAVGNTSSTTTSGADQALSPALRYTSGMISPLLALGTVRGLQCMLTTLSKPNNEVVGTSNTTSVSSAGLDGLDALIKDNVKKMLQPLLLYLSEALKDCTIPAQALGACSPGSLEAFNAAWSAASLAVVCESTTTLAGLWARRTNGASKPWTRLTLLQCGAHLLEVFQLPQALDQFHSTLRFLSCDFPCKTPQRERLLSDFRVGFLAPTFQIAFQLAHRMLAELPHGYERTGEFLLRFRSACYDVKNWKNLAQLFASLGNSFRHARTVCLAESNADCSWKLAEAMMCGESARANVTTWICFLLPFALGHHRYIVRTVAAQAILQLLRFVVAVRQRKGSSVPTSLLCDDNNNNDSEDAKWVELLARASSNSIFDNESTPRLVHRFLLERVKSPAVEDPGETSPTKQYQWKLGIIELTQTLRMDTLPLRLKVAAAATLQVVLLRSFDAQAHPVLKADCTGGSASEQENVDRGEAVDVTSAIAGTIKCLYKQYHGHDRFIVSSPVINGFCGWVTDSHCQRDSDEYKTKQRRFQNVVATLVQMPLQHSLPAPACGNGLPHEARILLRAVASGYCSTVGECPREFSSQPSAMFKKLLEMLTNVINSAAPFIGADRAIDSTRSGSISKVDALSLHPSTLRAVLHVLEDLFAPASWRTSEFVKNSSAVNRAAEARSKSSGAGRVDHPSAACSTAAEDVAELQYLSPSNCFYTGKLAPIVESFCRRHYLALVCTLLGGIGRLNVMFFQQKYIAKCAVQRQLHAVVFGEDSSSLSSSSDKRVEGSSKSRNGGTTTKEQQQEVAAQQQAYQEDFKFRQREYQMLLDSYYRVMVAVLHAAGQFATLDNLRNPMYLNLPALNATLQTPSSSSRNKSTGEPGASEIGSEGPTAKEPLLADVEDFIDFSIAARGEPLLFSSAFQHMRSEESFHVGIQAAVFAIVSASSRDSAKAAGKAVGAMARQFGRHLHSCVEDTGRDTRNVSDTQHSASITAVCVFVALAKIVFQAMSSRLDVRTTLRKRFCSSDDPCSNSPLVSMNFDCTFWKPYTDSLMHLASSHSAPLVRAYSLRAVTLLMLASQASTNSPWIVESGHSVLRVLSRAAGCESSADSSDLVRACAIAALVDCATCLPTPLFISHISMFQRTASRGLSILRQGGYSNAMSTAAHFAAISTLGEPPDSFDRAAESSGPPPASTCQAALVRRCSLRLWHAVALRHWASSNVEQQEFSISSNVYIEMALAAVTHLRAEASLTRTAAIRAIQAAQFIFAQLNSVNGDSSSTESLSQVALERWNDLLQSHVEEIPYTVQGVRSSTDDDFFDQRVYQKSSNVWVARNWQGDEAAVPPLQLQRLELRSHDEFLEAFVPVLVTGHVWSRDHKSRGSRDSAATVLVEQYRAFMRQQLQCLPTVDNCEGVPILADDASIKTAMQRVLQQELSEWEIVRGNAAVSMAVGFNSLHTQERENGTNRVGVGVWMELEALLLAPNCLDRGSATNGTDYARTRAARALGILAIL